MRTDIDHIISLMKRYTTSNSNEELDEQDEAPASSAPAAGGGGGSTTNTGRKWETGLTRGKANKLGLAGEKWETGLTRSVANQIDYKAKWKDLNKITRGKANTLL